MVHSRVSSVVKSTKSKSAAPRRPIQSLVPRVTFLSVRMPTILSIIGAQTLTMARELMGCPCGSRKRERRPHDEDGGPQATSACDSDEHKATPIGKLYKGAL